MIEIPISQIFKMVPGIEEAGGYFLADGVNLLDITPQDVNFQFRFAFGDLLTLLAQGKCKLHLTKKDLKNLVKEAEVAIKDLKNDLAKPMGKRNGAGTDEEVKADIDAQEKILAMWRNFLKVHSK